MPASKGGASKPTLVYAGTYTDTKSKGIYFFRLKTENLEVEQNITLLPLGLAVETENPSFLVVDARRRLVFAVNEVDRYQGKPGGAASAFVVDAATGKLSLINQVSSMGAGPCHVALDRSGRNLLLANYGSGSAALFPVAEDGKIGQASDVVQHSGKSVHPERQKGPHAHCVTLDPAGRFAFVCDLGVDKIFAYRLDTQPGKLIPADPPFTAAKPGSGPRHIVFRPDGRFAYVVNELSSTAVAYAYDAKTSLLKEIQNVSTLPGYYDGPNLAGEVDVHPSGRFLYVSNRGNDTVVLFSIDPGDGTLTYVEEQGTGGRTPRHFGIQPSARHLVIANQNSDTLLVCRIDAGNGRLKPSGVFAAAPSPACAQFLAPAEEAAH
jgi:6-phosphogluconolactonase